MKHILVLIALCLSQMVAAQFSLGISGGLSKPVGEFGQLNPADPADGMALDGWQAGIETNYMFNRFVGLGVNGMTTRNGYESYLAQNYLQMELGQSNVYFAGGAYQSISYTLAPKLGYGSKNKAWGIYFVPQIGGLTMLPQMHSTNVYPCVIQTKFQSATTLLFGCGLDIRWYLTKVFGLGFYANYLLSGNLKRIYETATTKSYPYQHSSTFHTESKTIQSLNLGLSLFWRVVK